MQVKNMFSFDITGGKEAVKVSMHSLYYSSTPASSIEFPFKRSGIFRQTSCVSSLSRHAQCFVESWVGRN